MSMIEFVQNYEDLSTDMGFQFKFHCDLCHNGHMSSFQASAVGVAGAALRVAGNLFGGVFGTAGGSAYEVQRAVGGKAHDDALRAAVVEGKQKFRQCGHCGKWVCPEVCWNQQVGQCNSCAPNFQQEFASAHAHAKADAARQQLQQKALATDYVEGVDMRGGAFVGAPPRTGAVEDAPQPQRLEGSPPAPSPQLAAAGPAACAKCGAQLGAFKFCPNCGTPHMQPAACAKCGTPLVPGMKFCGGCGAPLG